MDVKRSVLVAVIVALPLGLNVALRFPDGLVIGFLSLSQTGAGVAGAVVAFVVIVVALARTPGIDRRVR